MITVNPLADLRRARENAVKLRDERVREIEEGIRNIDAAIAAFEGQESLLKQSPTPQAQAIREHIQLTRDAMRLAVRNKYVSAISDVLTLRSPLNAKEITEELEKRNFDFGNTKSPISSVGIILKNGVNRGDFAKDNNQRFLLPMK